jgi:hypothetical protein
MLGVKPVKPGLSRSRTMGLAPDMVERTGQVLDGKTSSDEYLKWDMAYTVTLARA